MTFTDYLWIKLIVMTIIAGAIGFYAGLTGRSIEEVLYGRKDPEDRP